MIEIVSVSKTKEVKKEKEGKVTTTLTRTVELEIEDITSDELAEYLDFVDSPERVIETNKGMAVVLEGGNVEWVEEMFSAEDAEERHYYQETKTKMLKIAEKLDKYYQEGWRWLEG